MWISRISIEFFGENFSPVAFLNGIDNDYNIFSSLEPGEISDVTKSPYGYGYLSIISPSIYGASDQLQEYEKWYIDFLYRNKERILSHPIENVNLYIEVFTDGGQLNFNVFSNAALKVIADNDISIPVSVYHIKTKQLKKMLFKANFSKKKIKQLISQG